MHCPRILKVRNPTSRLWPSWFFFRDVGEGSFLCPSPWLLENHLLPYLSLGSLPQSRSQVWISPFYIDTSHTGLQPTLMTSFKLHYLCSLSSDKDTFRGILRDGVRNSTYESWGRAPRQPIKHALPLFVFTITLRGEYYCYPHFTEKDIVN